MISSLLVCLVVTALPGEAEGEAGFQDFYARAEAQTAKKDDSSAIALYREAEAFKSTPQAAVRLAQALERLGDGASATLYYRLALTRAPEAPEAAALAQSIGTFLGKAGSAGLGLLEVFAPRASRVRIQGKGFPLAPAALFVPPGEYVVEADFPSGPRTTRVRVKGGQVATLTFEPVQPPLLGVEQALSDQAIARGSTADEGPPPNVLRVVGIVALVVGAIAAGVGIALGASSASDARVARDTSVPRAQRLVAATAANQKAVPANTLMIAGGAAAAGGGVLLIISLPEPGVKKQ